MSPEEDLPRLRQRRSLRNGDRGIGWALRSLTTGVVKASFVLLIIIRSSAAAALPEVYTESTPRLAATAAQVRTITIANLPQLRTLTGAPPAGAPIRLIVADEHSRLALETPRWISGYALPDRGVIVIFPMRPRKYPHGGLEELVIHELAHVLVARAAGGQPVPRWFQEGLATFAGRTSGFEDETRFSLEVMSSGRTPLAVVESMFRGGETETARAYSISSAFVREIQARHGRDSCARILAEVSRGRPFPTAFDAALQVRLNVAEERFWRSQTLWRRWIPFATSSILLWLIVTILAGAAIRRRRNRDRARLRQWEAEELAGEIQPEDPTAPEK